jgi:hypothetical protein
VITMTMTGGGTAVLSLQNGSGAQVAGGYQVGAAAAIVYECPATGTYYVICSQTTPTNATTTYTLSIPAPALPVFTTVAITAANVLTPNNANVTVTVNAASGSAWPMGTVTLTNTTTNQTYGPLTLTSVSATSGSATFTIASPPLGVYNLIANYTPAGPPFQPNQIPGTGSLTVGVPNVKLAPPPPPGYTLRSQGHSPVDFLQAVAVGSVSMPVNWRKAVRAARR